MKISFWEKITGLNKEKLNQGSFSSIEDESIEEKENFFDQLEKESSTGKALENKKKDEAGKGPWLEEEGQLTIDVYQTDSEVVVRSTIAGVKRKDLNISVEKDLITIKGERKKEEIGDIEYLHQECFWGKFSRSIVLPQEIEPKQIKASLRSGILTIILPKAKNSNKKKSVRIRPVK